MASPVRAQGSRRDDIIFGPSGHPIAGATIRVCQPTATGTPCTPLATIYTDATLTVTTPNPFQADGIGNYHFYAPAGRYVVQISGPQVTGAITYPDVILPADVSSSGAGNNISAFGLTLGGNLSVAGNATISGTLSSTGFNPGTLTPNTLSVLGNETVIGPRPRVDATAFGAKGDNTTDDTAAIQAAITAACGTGATGGGSLYLPTAGIGAAYITNNTQVKPNEPATAMVAFDNNGHNWTPSMHYGMNDLAGDNLLGNASFEGWQNTTTLYYCGGVAAGGTINQTGSGIYLQNASSSATPAVDGYTQGAYNVRLGDGATAGLGINSGCIQVDATKEYTLMMRVAASSTSNNFRPGFRFYWDANCTSADVISTVATNARVLTPANYDGNSTATGNWQSTNASLTYNNGITCGCNVTGLDWQVSTAGAWTPTRNYGLIFRVPNGYSVGTTVAHSMRVFLLENTAAAGNYVYFDDVVLSQGPVTPDLRLAPLHDSQNPTVYGSLGVSQHLNQGAANTFAGTVALASGTATVTFPTAYNSAPVCTAKDTSTIATVRVQTTATTLTLSQSSGTDTIMYICVGNPN
ncbi:MAG: glycosyl hydrolase family 28-related protein [Candidatus Acidiferrales bacterium]